MTITDRVPKSHCSVGFLFRRPLHEYRVVTRQRKGNPLDPAIHGTARRIAYIDNGYDAVHRMARSG